MPRFYVTMTWDDWPEGGSYGTVVEAEDHDAAEDAAKWEMAASRAEERDMAGDPGMDQEIFDTYADQWHVVDCFDLDTFIADHINLKR